VSQRRGIYRSPVSPAFKPVSNEKKQAALAHSSRIVCFWTVIKIHMYLDNYKTVHIFRHG
jgi:hypothetical protein